MGSERAPRMAPDEAFAPPSGSMRRTTPTELLLSIALEAPVGEGTRATIAFLLDQLSHLFPDVAVGIRAEEVHGATWVDRRVPPGFYPSTLPGPHEPFGKLPGERVYELDELGSTLHFAAAETIPRGAGEDASFSTAARVARRCLTLSRVDLRQVTEERDRLKARIVQAEKLASLGQITANIAHELNNPLTAIIADSAHLRRRTLMRQMTGEHVDDDLARHDRLAEAAARILRFSRDLVSYARPTSEVPETLEVNDLVRRALGACEHELDRLSIRLQDQLDEDLPRVRGVSSQLAQVFVNLITNAAHAAAEGGRAVTVRTRREDRWVVTHVSDNGVGIRDEDLDRIFEPFFTTKPQGHGTGLGLSIVRDIVDRHGGVLSVETRPGRGATFLVRLPLSE